jgi:cell wall-associated NlpC family hydrolase
MGTPTSAISAPEIAPSTETTAVASTGTDTVSWLFPLTGRPAELTLLERQQLRVERLLQREVAIERVLTKLKKHQGKTWYVFSGSTPAGWDCSGLVRWTYEQLGVELEHSANKQAHAGKRVTNPLPGDVVAWGWQGSKHYYHTGIYLGDGKVIQALRPGTSTSIVSVDSPLFAGSKPVFVRVLERDPSPEPDWAILAN